MSQHSLHLDATWLLAHRITTLASVNKEVDDLLYRGLTLLSGVFLGRVLLDIIIQSQAEFVHQMYVPHFTKASNTKVKVLVREGVSGGREGIRKGGRGEGSERGGGGGVSEGGRGVSEGGRGVREGGGE